MHIDWIFLSLLVSNSDSDSESNFRLREGEVVNLVETTARVGSSAALSEDVEVVVSWYKEDLGWISEMNLTTKFPIKIYAKGIAEHPVYQRYIAGPIPNLGMESHTYIYHIVHNYDNLAPCTIFAVGGITAAERGRLKVDKLEYALAHIDTCEEQGVVIMADNVRGKKIMNFDRKFTIEHWASHTKKNRDPGTKQRHFPSCSYEDRDTEKCKKIQADKLAYMNAQNALIPAQPRPIGEWYQKYLPFDASFEKIDKTGSCYNGVFAASRAAIRSHPVEMYREILKQLEVGQKTEANHYMERLWLVLFASDKSDYMQACDTNANWARCEDMPGPVVR
jgi:hypothetical protein